MVQKLTFRKTFEHTRIGVGNYYVSVLDLNQPLGIPGSEFGVKELETNNTAATNLENAVLLVDATTLVYRELAVSFAGATRCTLALSLKNVFTGGGYDGYMWSREASCTHLPCAPTWDILWYAKNTTPASTSALAPGSGPYLCDELLMGIYNNTAETQKYFTIIEYTLYDTTT